MKDKEIYTAVKRALREQIGRIPLAQLGLLSWDAPLDNPEQDFFTDELSLFEDVLGREVLVKTVPLVAVWKKESYPQRVREACGQLLHNLSRLEKSKESPYGIFIAPFISEASANICTESGIGYIDLAGNSRLSFGKVFLERRVTDRNPAPRQESQSLFSTRATRVLRVLLTGPLRTWKVKELAEASKVSIGWVSQVRRQLVANEWAVANEAGLRITQPSALLEAWASHDDWKPRTTIRGYSVLSGDPNEIALKVRDLLGDSRHALTQWYAGWLRRPYTTPPVVTVYVEEFPDEKLLEKNLLARRVDSGAQLWLVKSRDEGVFVPTQVIKDFTLASDVQIYLDLLKVGLRGPEQAEELRKASDFAGGWS